MAEEKKRWERKPIKIGNNRFTISCKFFSIVTYYSTTVVYLLCHSRQYRQYRLFFSTIISVSSLDFSNSFNCQRYFHDHTFHTISYYFSKIIMVVISKGKKVWITFYIHYEVISSKLKQSTINFCDFNRICRSWSALIFRLLVYRCVDSLNQLLWNLPESMSIALI